MINKEVIDKVKQVVEDSNKIVLLTHMSPDGDAIGSSCALGLFLKKLGKTVNIITPDDYPEYLSWVPGIDLVSSYSSKRLRLNELIKAADLIFFLDHNVELRQGFLEPIVKKNSCTKIMIDHHPFPKANVDFCFSRTDVTSTCEMVYNFIKDIYGTNDISSDIATSIYVGINTDTGGLNYNSSNPETYVVVADLLSKGINKMDIHERLYNTFSENRLRLVGYCLHEEMIVLNECSSAIICLSKSIQEKYNFQNGDSEGLVNIPHQIKGIDVSILITEKEDRVKLSFRSKGCIPINKFAERFFDGGGHTNAAGGMKKTSLEDAVEIIKKNLPDFMNEYKMNEK